MGLIERYVEGLTIIEIYDDYQLKEKEAELALKELYDLCNLIIINLKERDEKIKEYFYTKKELDELNK